MGSISAIGLFKVIRQQLFVIGMSTILDNGLRFLHGRFASQVGDSLLGYLNIYRMFVVVCMRNHRN